MKKKGGIIPPFLIRLPGMGDARKELSGGEMSAAGRKSTMSQAGMRSWESAHQYHIVYGVLIDITFLVGVLGDRFFPNSATTPSGSSGEFISVRFFPFCELAPVTLFLEVAKYAKRY